MVAAGQVIVLRCIVVAATDLALVHRIKLSGRDRSRNEPRRNDEGLARCGGRRTDGRNDWRAWLGGRGVLAHRTFLLVLTSDLSHFLLLLNGGSGLGHMAAVEDLGQKRLHLGRRSEEEDGKKEEGRHTEKRREDRKEHSSNVVAVVVVVGASMLSSAEKLVMEVAACDKKKTVRDFPIQATGKYLGLSKSETLAHISGDYFAGHPLNRFMHGEIIAS